MDGTSGLDPPLLISHQELVRQSQLMEVVPQLRLPHLRYVKLRPRLTITPSVSLMRSQRALCLLLGIQSVVWIQGFYPHSHRR